MLWQRAMPKTSLWQSLEVEYAVSWLRSDVRRMRLTLSFLSVAIDSGATGLCERTATATSRCVSYSWTTYRRHSFRMSVHQNKLASFSIAFRTAALPRTRTMCRHTLPCINGTVDFPWTRTPSRRCQEAQCWTPYETMLSNTSWSSMHDSAQK